MLTDILKTHKYIVTMEDGSLNGGFGSAVAEYIIDNNYSNLLIRFGIPDRFIEHGKIELLEKDLGLLPEQMAEKIKEKISDINYKVVG